MPLSATSIASKPMEALAWLLASSAAFRAAVGAADAAEAFDQYIHFPEADDRIDPNSGQMMHPRPRAIIYQGPDFRTRRNGTGSWNNAGSLGLSLEIPVPAEHLGNRREEELWFANLYGRVVLEMRENSGLNDGTHPYLNASEFALAMAPMPCDSAEEGGEYFYGVELRVSWPN